jgi:hypothetical protein
MQNHFFHQIEALEEHPHSPISAETLPFHPSAWAQIKQATTHVFTKEGREEIGAASLVIIAFFLTGWFYYNLYQALQDYRGF